MMPLALVAVLAGTPPVAALRDPAWARHRSHLQLLGAMPEPAPVAALPLARPSPRFPDGALYRLPIEGRILREAPDVPDHARGSLLLRGTAGARAVAPASGRVAYAGPFRHYGAVLILDHGHGWTTVLTGLARLTVFQGATLRGGDPIGRLNRDVHVQLLHRGRPADVMRIAASLGGVDPLVIPPQGALR